MGVNQAAGGAVLCVDPDAAGGIRLREILTAEGFAVDLLERGDDAVRALARGSFRLVFTEIALPGADGFAVISAARAARPVAPAIVVSTRRLQTEVIDIFRAGASAFIPKPFEKKDVLGAVKSVLEGGPVDDLPEGLIVQNPFKDWVEITAPSHEKYIERFEHFCNVLLSQDLPAETLRDIQIAIDEIGRNAVEWGNKRNPDRMVRITYCIFADKMVFKVEDEGEGFDHRALFDPSSDPWTGVAKREEEGKRPGGYGILLARKIMDEFYFNSRGNIVIMAKRLAK